LLFYNAVFVLQIDNFYLLVLVLLSLILLSAVFISKLSVDPLESYVKNLQNLSTETLHELNLPISTIKTNVQMLQRKLDDEKTQKRLGRIEGACNMLKERYDELDYMIKMQSKEDVKEFFYLDELIAQRVDFLQKLYPHFLFEVESEHIAVECDKIGLAKVIDNIIDNGIKYSGESKTIKIVNKENYLFIQDFGIGMSEVELLKIFDAFYQTNSQMQGFGIGLSMVKRFCDKNNIELLFDSTPQVGTTVKLQFKNNRGIN
jgi:signal transduction histidine kinase